MWCIKNVTKMVDIIFGNSHKPTSRYNEKMNMNDSKKQIIEKALFLFIKNGFNGVSLADILKEVKLSKGSFYYYFTSKEKCFEECVMFFLSNTKADLTYCNSTSLYDFIELLTQNVSNSVVKFNAIDRISFINDAIKIIPGFSEQFSKRHFEELKVWSEIVTRAIESGEIRNILPAEEVAKLFVYQSDGLILNLSLRRETDNLREETKSAWMNLYNLLKV
jgi:AcrR family transcriptional regulator